MPEQTLCHPYHTPRISSQGVAWLVRLPDRSRGCSQNEAHRRTVVSIWESRRYGCLLDTTCAPETWRGSPAAGALRRTRDISLPALFVLLLGALALLASAHLFRRGTVG